MQTNPSQQFLTQLLDTEEAASFLRLKPQTLRRWACYDQGPIRPVKVGKRLRWRLADLERLVNGEASHG